MTIKTKFFSTLASTVQTYFATSNHSRAQRCQTNLATEYQPLEPRQLLATFVSLDSQVLVIRGDVGNNEAEVQYQGDDSISVVTNDSGTFEFDRTQVDSIDFSGGSGDDVFLNLTSISSVAYGHSGADQLTGGSGNDQLFGGFGNDTLLGGLGDDTLSGQDDDDLIRGFGGNDRILGGAGQDVLNAGPGDDFLNGGHGDDILVGGAGDDELLGFTGNDSLTGDEGDDQLYGPV